MKITFKNLGAIRETEIDLRPLTVIIGPNNTNKTYLAYSIYGISKYAGNVRLSLRSGPSHLKLGNDGRGTLTLTPRIKANLIKELGQRAIQFSSQLRGFFQDSSGKLFSRKTFFDLNISDEDLDQAINRVMSLTPFSSPERTSVKVERQGERLLFSRHDNTPIGNPNHATSKVRVEDHLPFEMVAQILMNALPRSLFLRPFLLPAERNAFILTYKLLATRRFKLLRESQRKLLDLASFSERPQLLRESQRQKLFKEIGDLSFPEPLEDFLDLLSDIELEGTRRNSGTKEFQALAHQIERHVQSGNRTALRSTKFGKEIRVDVTKELSIDLYNASSSIKQLAPLLLYLRYRAEPGDLLIIDEPEIGLHPGSQAKLLEALAIYVHLGGRILLTTHSPYIMAHLNNLVGGNVDEPDILKKQAKSLYLKDQRAFLKMDQVSAYEMKENKLVSLKDDDYGIRWDTLSDVSSVIQQDFFKIYEQGHQASKTSKE
jgi:hypothetical protein